MPQNSKFEARNPKQIRSTNWEKSKQTHVGLLLRFGIRIGFGFRISDFEANLKPPILAIDSTRTGGSLETLDYIDDCAGFAWPARNSKYFRLRKFHVNARPTAAILAGYGWMPSQS